MVNSKQKVEGQSYSLTESESRVSLEDTRFKSFYDLLNALRQTYSVTKIKDYAFKDTYFWGKRDFDASKDVTRVRVWSKYLLANGTEKPQPVQIVRSSANIEIDNGIPFNIGGKKSKKEVSTFDEAVATVSKRGLSPLFTIEKHGGMHFRVDLGEGAEVRIACELAVFIDNRSENNWKTLHRKYIEIEVESSDKAVVSEKIGQIMEFLGIKEGALIGHPMAVEASEQLATIRRA